MDTIFAAWEEDNNGDKFPSKFPSLNDVIRKYGNDFETVCNTSFLQLFFCFVLLWHEYYLFITNRLMSQPNLEEI